ncbi:MAG TPA: hypothetical protein VFD49_22630 [Candidatus Dormibacteraeota bacterium]|nr:hypothetical protein [Candidatus Dormibacteraeota bacterium]
MRRQLLGGVAIALALAAAVWYVTAPSRSAPSGGLQVAVHGQAAGGGGWTRYLITVEDLADGTFDGDVLLTEPGSAGASPTSVTLSLPFVAARLPVAPVTAGPSAYRVHLTVPSRTSRTFTILAPDTFTTVEAVAQGQVLDAEAVQRASAVQVAVLSAQDGPADAIAGLRFGGVGTRVDAYGSARDLPADPLLLAGYATIVVDDFDSTALSPAQVRALRDFVGLGGSLVLAGGPDWRRTLGPLPPALLAVRPQATARLGLEPVAVLAGTSPPAAAVPALIGRLAPGARPILLETDGTPLMAELDHGAGRVIELAFDPEGAGAYRQLAWSQALAQSLDPPAAGNTPPATAIPGPIPQLALLLAPPTAPVPPPGLVAAVVLLYVLLVGPINYLVLYRRFHRPLLTWAAVPAASLVFVGLFSLAGLTLQAAVQDRAMQIVKAGPDGAEVVLEYDRVSFLRRGDHRILATGSGLAAPLTLDAYQATASACPTCATELGGLPAGSENVLPAPRPAIEENGIIYGSQRVVATVGAGRAEPALQANLESTNGRVRGTVHNPGRQPVVRLTLFNRDGRSGALQEARLGDLAPGGGISANAAWAAVGAQTGSTTAVEQLLRSVALSELGGRAGSVLVGLTLPRPGLVALDGSSPSRPSLAVLEQPVTVAAADPPTHFERTRLASSRPSGSGLLDTYDVWVPSTSAPLVVEPGSLTGVEVYDWSRGAFVPLQGEPLGPGEVHDGLVRVRGQEARLSWGSGLLVAPASG